MLEKRIEIIIVVMFAIIFGITIWFSIMQGRATESYDVEVIYFGAALIVYVVYYLMKQAWKRVRGVSYLSLTFQVPYFSPMASSILFQSS